MRRPVLCVLAAVLALHVYAASSPVYRAGQSDHATQAGSVTTGKANPLKLVQNDMSASIIQNMSKEGLHLAQGYKDLAQKNYTKAMRHFFAAMQFNPDNADAYRAVALIYWQRDHDAQAASVYFHISLSKPFSTPDVHLDYANYLANQKKMDESLDHLYKTLDRWPRAKNVRARIAHIYLEQNNHMKACKWANSALENDDQLQLGLLERACGQA
jgi:tetratricopeptide (TPR) repeat protein